MEIRNMEITEGIHNDDYVWGGIEASMGNIEITLENGTTISIVASKAEGGYYNAEVKFFHLNDTKITVFNDAKNVGLKKKSIRSGTTSWVKLESKA